MDENTFQNNLKQNDFKIPKLHNVLSRERITKLLKERSDRKLILICAKAGQGKSTIAADFLRNSKFDNIWIRLNKRDSNPSLLLDRLNKALLSIYPELKDKTVESSLSMETIFNRSTNSSLYIVLEDLHKIFNSKESCNLINKIINKSPSNIHIIILTREYPDLSLSRIRSQKEMFELLDRDISFLEEDVQKLASEVYNLDLSPIEIHRISNIIDGWTTGYIFLFEKLSCIENISEKNVIIEMFLKELYLPEALDFFNEQIFLKASRNIQIQLIKLSFFKAITPVLLERIITKNGKETLQDFIKQGYFISIINNKKDYYSFHPIFRKLLQSHTKSLKSEIINEVLTIGTEFYKETKDYEKAIENLIKLGKLDDARNLFINSAEELLDQSKYRKIRRILNVFPNDVIESDLILDYYNVIVDNLKKPFSTRKKFPEFLKYFEANKDYDRQARIYSILLANYFFYQENNEVVRATAVESEIFLNANRDLLSVHRKEILEALIPIGQEWKTPVDDYAFERVMRAEETSKKYKNNEAFLSSRLVLARKYIQRGEFKAANILLEKTKVLFDINHLDHPYNSLVSFYLGDTFFYMGDIYKAIKNVQEALSQASQDFAFRPYLEQNLILYHLYLDKHEPAESLIEQGVQDEKYENVYLKYFRSFLLPMLNAYRRGNRRRTDYYSKNLMAKENEPVMMSDFPHSYIQLIEVNIVLEHFKIAEELLNKIESSMTYEHTPYPLSTVYALRGLLLHLQNNSKAAAAQFKKMDNIFMEKGYKNLDICDPAILDQIASISKYKYFSEFPRLKSRLITSNYKKENFLLEIKTLGTFSLYIKGREIASNGLLSQKRVMDLLKLLIIYRKNGILKEMIYEPFWPKYSNKSARDNLNTIIYRLRNILGKENDILLTDSNTIGFKEGTVIIDVDRFLKFLNIAEEAEHQKEFGTAAEMYNKALDIYKGDFLESDIYSDFIRDEREHLKQKFRFSQFKLAKLYLNTGNYLQALETLKALIVTDPLCEAGTRLLMITSALIGSRSNIPRILDKLNRQLLEAYDVTVDKKTLQLKETLLSGIDPDPSMWEDETII